MSRKKKLTLVQAHKSTIIDMIWMSIRYCVGRHTIAAGMHPSGLVSFINDCPEITFEDKEGFSIDVIRQINEVIGFNNNIYIQLFQQNDKYDALLVLSKFAYDWCQMHGKDFDEFNEWYKNQKLELDCLTGTVRHEKMDLSEKKIFTNTLFNMECDLKVWSMFNQWLHPRFRITYKDVDGEEITEDAIKFYSIGRRSVDDDKNYIEEHYTPVSVWGERPHINPYISPEYITKIESI